MAFGFYGNVCRDVVSRDTVERQMRDEMSDRDAMMREGGAHW